MAGNIKRLAGGFLNGLVNAVPAKGSADLSSQRQFPVPQPDDRRLAKQLRRGTRKTFFCNICGRRSLLWKIGDDRLRETINCFSCDSYNKQRQLAAVILKDYPGVRSLRDLAGSGVAVRTYNTEIGTPIDRNLSGLKHYVNSEYFDAGGKSGDLINGQLHQDLRGTSFTDGSFDLVISADVLEHVPEPYRAHEEIFRILAPGGRHVMAVPFHHDGFEDERLAETDGQGKARHLKDPVYHGDQNRDQGVLTYTIFGLESLLKLRRLGYQPTFYNLNVPKLGIIGRHAFVFELRKPAGLAKSDRRRERFGYY